MVARANGFDLSAAEYLRLLDRREQARLAWADFFDEWDVLICPAALDAAFPHQQAGGFQSHTLEIDGATVSYHQNVVYPMWAIFGGQPATPFLGGSTREVCHSACKRSAPTSRIAPGSGSHACSNATGSASVRRPRTREVPIAPGRRPHR